MIDSWNAAKLNERISQVESKIQANDVIANPEGAATASLSKVSVDGTIYDLTDSNIVTLKVPFTWTPGTAPATVVGTLTLEDLGITKNDIIAISIISGSGAAVGFVPYISTTAIGLSFRQFGSIASESAEATIIINYRK